MYLTAHGTAGLLIARFIPNPILAFVVGMVSHLVLDFIPHGDEHIADQKRFSLPQAKHRIAGAALLDGILLTFFVLLYIATTPTTSYQTIIWAFAGAVLPDILQGIYLVTNTRWLKEFNHVHQGIHNMAGHKLNWKQGMLVQAMTFTALWLMLI